jgi:hypothetical protein
VKKENQDSLSLPLRGEGSVVKGKREAEAVIGKRRLMPERYLKKPLEK